MADRTWLVPPRITKKEHQKLTAELEIPDLLAQCLVQRGLGELEKAANFLSPSLNQLHDPALFQDMDRACQRIWEAVEQKEKILIHGDYDADGVTATTLLLDFFDLLGAKADWHIPNRLTEGFSFSPRVMRRVEEEGFSLCITVDNGINAVAEVKQLAALGCDVIITDHHETGPELPEAHAIIDPKVPGCTYPYAGLAGVGVAFKLAWGVARRFSGSQMVSPKFREFLLRALELVALGTVADVVPLLDENRILVAHGLKAISHSPSKGLQELKDICKLAGKTITTVDIAFRLAPRINAAGRMGAAENALALLRSQNRDEAWKLAWGLDQSNQERQRIERTILEEARSTLTNNPDQSAAPVILLASRNWSPGVVGIVAARLCDEFGKPAVVIALDDEVGRGSARSPEGFPIHEAFNQADDLLISHGGHAKAAGLKVAPERLEELRERLHQVGTKLHCPLPPLTLDGEIKLAEITPILIQSLNRMSPYGMGNREPLFAALDLVVAGHPWTSGYGARDLSFLVKQDDQTHTAVYRNGAKILGNRITRGLRLSLVVTPKMAWRKEEIELQIKEIRFLAEDGRNPLELAKGDRT